MKAWCVRIVVAAGAALAAAAVALHASSTLGWAGADAPDGTRYKASPVGLSHVLTPHAAESRTVDCGWHAASGHPLRCSIASEPPFRRLRAVYPLLLAAFGLAPAGGIAALSPLPVGVRGTLGLGTDR